MHGYSKVNEKHLREVFNKLQITSADSLLDIGCGKGVVLKEARKYSFEKVTGIEIQENLANIAKKNFEILKLDNVIECIQQDALKFDKYGEYNIFFMFNPFGSEIMEEVINKIIEQTRNAGKRVYIIYHNPVYKDVIENKKVFVKEMEFFDSLKQYYTYVYRMVK